jgi:hypothetical protein
MTNVAQIRTFYRDAEITTNNEYVKYETYVIKGYEAEFERHLSDQEGWTWSSKTEVKVL